MSLKRFREQRKAQASGQAPPPPPPQKRKGPPPINMVGSIMPTQPTLFEIPFVPMNRAPTPYDPTGPLLANDYTIDCLIGQGVTAYVFKCSHKATGHEFAVKCVDKGCLSNKADTLQNEVFILSHVRHSNIAHLVALYEDDDQVYLVTPLMKGGELFDRIVKTCPNGYTERHAARIMKSILGALDYLHGNGIIHRDLKPENLLFPTENIMATNVMVSDFGLAKIWTKDTLLKTACGSPNYVAPEVLLKNMDGYTVAADMWSAGVIAYVLLCGFCPFHHEQTPMLLKLIIIGHYTFPSPYWDTISKEAQDFVSRLLVRDPSKRASAAQAMQHPWIQQHQSLSQNQQQTSLPVVSATAGADGTIGGGDAAAEGAGPTIPDISDTLKLFQQMQMKDGERRRQEADDVNNFTAHVKQLKEQQQQQQQQAGGGAGGSPTTSPAPAEG